MKKLASVLATALISPLTALAGVSESVFQTGQGFDKVLSEALTASRPKDAFLGLSECKILDAVMIRPYTLNEAVDHLRPCLKAVSARYGAELSGAAGIIAKTPAGAAKMGILLAVPGDVAFVRDLNRSLSLRKGRLLGHPATIRRMGQKTLSVPSAAQEALDRCVVPAVLRPIESGEDFVRHYGRCITDEPSLKVRALQAAAGRKLAVTALSAADRPMIERLNGLVSVNGEKGPVEILVIAYPETVFLP